MESRHAPSVFELTACEGLKSGLREAFRYLVNNLYLIDGVRRLPLPKPDEAVLLVDLLIEYNYLRSYNASYAENLYHLVRTQQGNDNDGSGIKAKILPSLICLTIVPYIRRKLDVYLEELNYKETRTADDLKKIRLYKIFNQSCSFIKLIFMLRFVADKSVHYSMLDALIGVRLLGRAQEDQDDDNHLPLADRVSKRIANFLGHGLTVGSYFIQFLDYWNTRSNSSSLFNASLPIPDAATKDGLMYTDDKSSNICLICLHVRQNECALSNTGYVFCYSCIQRYVSTRQRCPVTGHPCSMNNIVKLFGWDESMS